MFGKDDSAGKMGYFGFPSREMPERDGPLVETDSVAGTQAPEEPIAGIRATNLLWVLLAFAVMTAAIYARDDWFLNFVHVIAGVLWTGIDLFMGFVVGPILRRVDLNTRRAIILRLMPRRLFLMPTLAIVTTTAGWFLADWHGYLDLPYPEFGWVIAALVIVAVLTVQGLAILLPLNLRVYFQMRSEAPDMARVGRWMSFYVRVIASQGVLQIAIIIIMARFVTGL